MAISFDPALTAPKDRIRQRIGDTDETTAQVQDETIAGYLAQGFSELGCARRLCLDLAAKWAPVGDVLVDRQRGTGSQIYNHYMNLARQLDLEGSGTTDPTASPGISVGGLTDPRGPTQDRPALDYTPFCQEF